MSEARAGLSFLLLTGGAGERLLGLERAGRLHVGEQRGGEAEEGREQGAEQARGALAGGERGALGGIARGGVKQEGSARHCLFAGAGRTEKMVAGRPGFLQRGGVCAGMGAGETPGLVGPPLGPLFGPPASISPETTFST